ncbi:MAG: 5-formyltetrahydrofolate cyclo-ligase [Myxococcales bacterium]|nr:5-formyltetrahydrofolate cyclo-ligase [Myxococcales bacterium]
MSGDARTTATAAACAHALAGLAEVPAGAVVALYSAMRGELATTAIAAGLLARGVALAYPVVRPGRVALQFRLASPDALVPVGRWQIPEPPEACPEVGLDRLAAVIVPALVLDRRGNRLGWGAGHYDRTLPACVGALRIGLVFELQLVDHLAPSPHDVPVHMIATEVALSAGAARARRGSPP